MLLVAACAFRPDPRWPSLDGREQQALGGWVIMAGPDGSVFEGELIVVGPETVHVLVWSPAELGQPPYANRLPRELVAVPRARIRNARLFPYASDSYALWGMLGALSTITHALLAVITFPMWIVLMVLADLGEADGVNLVYPEHRLEEFSIWARFPRACRAVCRRARSSRAEPRSLGRFRAEPSVSTKCYAAVTRSRSRRRRGRSRDPRVIDRRRARRVQSRSRSARAAAPRPRNSCH